MVKVEWRNYMNCIMLLLDNVYTKHQAKNGPWAVREETGNSGPQVRWRAISEFLPSAKQLGVWCGLMWSRGSLPWPMAARNFNNKNHNLLCCSKHILLLLFISTICWTAIWMICINTTTNEWMRLKRCKLAKTIGHSLFPGGPGQMSDV